MLTTGSVYQQEAAARARHPDAVGELHRGSYRHVHRHAEEGDLPGRVEDRAVDGGRALVRARHLLAEQAGAGCALHHLPAPSSPAVHAKPWQSSVVGAPRRPPRPGVPLLELEQPEAGASANNPRIEKTANPLARRVTMASILLVLPSFGGSLPLRGAPIHGWLTVRRQNVRESTLAEELYALAAAGRREVDGRALRLSLRPGMGTIHGVVRIVGSSNSYLDCLHLPARRAGRTRRAVRAALVKCAGVREREQDRTLLWHGRSARRAPAHLVLSIRG